ncbi:MAG: hypothetical protein ACLPID_19970 [Beijerinckiaceae bacterium]
MALDEAGLRRLTANRVASPRRQNGFSVGRPDVLLFVRDGKNCSQGRRKAHIRVAAFGFDARGKSQDFPAPLVEARHQPVAFGLAQGGNGLRIVAGGNVPMGLAARLVIDRFREKACGLSRDLAQQHLGEPIPSESGPEFGRGQFAIVAR